MATKLDHALVRELRESTKKTDADLAAIDAIIGSDVLRVAGNLVDSANPVDVANGRSLSRIAKRCEAGIKGRVERAARVRADISDDRVNQADARRIRGLAHDSETCRVTLMGLTASLDHLALTAARTSVKEACAVMATDIKKMSEAAFERIDADMRTIDAVLDAVA